MIREKKPFKSYLIIFLFATVIIIAYTLYLIFAQDSSVSEVYTLWFMPFLFTLFYWGSDSIILKFANRKKKVNYEAKFLDEISQSMRDSKLFIVEDFRRLQINSKFQEDLRRAYQIYENGETEIFTISKLEKKYRKNTLENKAMNFVVDYLKETKKDAKTE